MNSSLFSDILDLVTPVLPAGLQLPARVVGLIVRDAEARDWRIAPGGLGEPSMVAAGRAAAREAALAGLPDAIRRTLKGHGLDVYEVEPCTQSLMAEVRARWAK